MKMLRDIRFWVLLAGLSLVFQLLFPPETYRHLLDFKRRVPASAETAPAEKPRTSVALGDAAAG